MSKGEPCRSEEGAGGQAAYQIRILGKLEGTWSDWFDGMTILPDCTKSGFPLTTMTGVIADQPQLRGIVSKLWDLNLTVLSILRVDPGTNDINSKEVDDGKTFEDGMA
jgi:hypothetical protein